jgi:hypothetical protein
MFISVNKYKVSITYNLYCNIHGLDRHRRYIYIYTVVLQKAEESSITEQNSTMLHLFDDLWLDKLIPKNNDEGRAINGNLENKIITL